MNASSRKAQQIIRQRALENHTRKSLRRGRSLATHVIAAGVPEADVQGVVNGLRTAAKKTGTAPVKVDRTHRTVEGKGRRLRPVNHYTADQVRQLAATYKPRKAEYRAARDLLLAA
jgi:hypothetical protein